MSNLVALCSIAKLQTQYCLGFDPLEHGKDTIFAIWHNHEILIYRNQCPHEPVTMEYRRHQFLTKDRSQIICYAHGARFEPTTGECVHGPCLGKQLKKIAYQLINEVIYVDKQELAP